MRFRFKPTAEQRASLRAQLERLQISAAAVGILDSSFPRDFTPVSVASILQKRHSDRFVLKVQLRSSAGEERSYALKVYSDDFGQRVWEHAQALAKHQPTNHDGLCLPTRYVPEERTLVFPWVEGQFLSDIVDHRKPDLLRQAARLAADLHRLPVVPEETTTAQMIVDETQARCARLRRRWPETGPMIAPLVAALKEAQGALDPADPAPVHGDLAAGQFLWTGDRLVLLDLDLFGYADPAYDAGHFLAQLERRCLWDSTVSGHARQWLACFRDAYLAAMDAAMRRVSPRNISFYRGLTLIRKIYTLCRTQPAEWPRLVPPLAVRARAALEEAASTEPVV
jgi:tRNA A-37 threonylcarbamoyl transferase component Bud32